MYVYAGGKSEEPTCIRFVVYFNLLCIEAFFFISIIILHILLRLQSSLKNNLSALSIELVLEVLLDLLGSAQVDCKLGRLLLLRRLDRLGEDLQGKCEQDENDRFAKLQLAKNDIEIRAELSGCCC